MKRRRLFVKGVALVAAVTAVGRADARAQLSGQASLSLAAPYVWRGLTRSNGWNVQPEVFVASRLAGGFFTAGAWANLEAGPPSPGNLSDRGGARPGFSEVDYWLQYGRPVGEMELTVGAVHYAFPAGPSSARRGPDDNTTEIYSVVQLTSTYLVPRLAAYLDVDEVRGAYIEGGVTVPLLAYPFGNPVVFYAGGLAGFNLGQELNPDRPAQRANFRHDGFTHVDFSLRATVRPLRSVNLSVNIEPHWQLKVDDFTQRTSPEPGDAERNTQFWLAVSVTSGIGLP
jgi:hypothetical protein